MSYSKSIKIKEVFCDSNVELKLDDIKCHACVSHVGRLRGGYVGWCRDGFHRMHRWVYWKETGERPEVVEHLCNNPWCVNIKHLKAGTFKSNAQYRDSLGRSHIHYGNTYAKGSKHLRKLSDEAVLFIRANKHVRTVELANKYGVSVRIINRVKRNETYTDVGGVVNG